MTAEELYNKILDDDEFKSFPDGLMCMGQFKKALADYKQSIIELIEDIQTTELLRGWKHTSDILEELIAKIKKVK